MEKFRVISDLHMDINRNYPFSIEDNDVFTVVAGDTSGEYAIVDYKVDNCNCSLSCLIKNTRKFTEYFGKRKRFKIEFSGNRWIFNGKKIDFDKAFLEIRKNGIVSFDKEGKRIEDSVIIDNGASVCFKVFYVHDWISKNIKNGILVSGNHIVYNKDHETIETLKNNLHEMYPSDSNVTFLDNSVGVMQKEVDGILFIGSTLYTDYKFSNDEVKGEFSYSRRGSGSDKKEISAEDIIQFNMRVASPKMSGGGMNDFNFGLTDECTYNKSWSLEADDDVSHLTPENYRRFFSRTFDEIKKIVSENKDKPIVIVTHHCPSKLCISKEYVDSMMNASYVSELDDFIIDNPNIKCWVCGHVHHRDSFMIGNCLVVMNPLGYCTHGQFKSGYESKTDWTPYLYVNTENWRIERKEMDNSKWNRKYDDNNRKREKLYRKYGGCFFW